MKLEWHHGEQAEKLIFRYMLYTYHGLLCCHITYFYLQHVRMGTAL